MMNDLPFLTDIINKFNIYTLISPNDKTDIELTMADMMDYYIENNPLSFSSPTFHEDMDNYVINIIIQTIEHIYTDKETLEFEIDEIYENVKKQYFTKYYPIRSYDDSFIRKRPNIQKMTLKINAIETKPQPDQRTNEWYIFRHNLITARSAWKVFKSQSSINQLIVEKCKL